MEKPQGQPKDVWASGMAYEPYVGRWSRLVAREFLRWLDLPVGNRWLDVGCGTGALSQTILEMAAPSQVTGIDRSQEFLAFARHQIQDPRLHVEVGDAQALPVELAVYDAVVSGLALNFVPQPEQALREMLRAVKPGGTVAAYVWDYVGEMQLMRHFWNAVKSLEPAAVALDEGIRFPLCQLEPLRALFQQGGAQTIDVRSIDIETRFRNFDDYWSPFLGGQGPAPTYALSLAEEQRTRLREKIRSALPFAADGSIPLLARAWAVRGMRANSP